MPLPTINNIVMPANPAALAPAQLNHSPVTQHNAAHQAKQGVVNWAGNTMQIAGGAGVNYCYIPAVHGAVSYGVVNCANGAGDFYVVSDQYGGCEYHELYNATTNQLAFLHIYRGGGTVAPYTPAQGWVVRGRKRSAQIAQQNGVAGSNWSVSLVDRTANPPTVQSKFIHIRNSGTPHVPILTVIAEDDGDSLYSIGETGYAKQQLRRIYNFFFG